MNTPANSTASTPSEVLQGLPRFDLQQWHNTAGDAAERQTMAESLCQACHDVGFFLLTNHGIDSALIDAVFDLSRNFFDLPLADRKSIDKRASRHFRGWESEGSEYTNGRPDIREQIDLWSEHEPRAKDALPAYHRLLGPNQWPSEALVPGFESALNAWFRDMGQTADELMVVLATGLGLSPDHFDKAFGTERMALTKLIRYPETPAGQFGVNAHHDAAFLTLLSPGTTPGLQIETAEGSWMDVPLVPGALVVNLCEILQSITGNYLLATPHRVITQTPRQSAAYFHGPSLDMELAPIELPARFVEAVANSPRHHGAGFMARAEETDAGVGDMSSDHRPAVYGEQLWNYFCRSYPDNVEAHYPDDV